MLYGGLRILLDPLRGDGRPEHFLGLSYQQGLALGVVLLASAWQRRVRRDAQRPNARADVVPG